MKDPVKDKLKRFGLFARFGEETFFATIGEAVNALPRAPSGRMGGLGVVAVGSWPWPLFHE